MNTTILIKTFQRPQAFNRLLLSIRQKYPTIPIVVIDDSGTSSEATTITDNWIHITTKFDIGLSAGRNLGINYINTDYVFICDDDCIFTEQTDLEKAEQLLKDSDVDILGIDAGVGYCGIFETKQDTVQYSRLTHGTQMSVIMYDFVPNIFLAKTKSLEQYKWDEQLKMGEHFAYFYDHLNKIKVGYTDKVKMVHEHISSPEYNKYRGRAIDYVKYYMKKKGITKRITFDSIDEI